MSDEFERMFDKACDFPRFEAFLEASEDRIPRIFWPITLWPVWVTLIAYMLIVGLLINARLVVRRMPSAVRWLFVPKKRG